MLRRPRIPLAALLLAHICILGWAAASNSVTFDEIWHLPAGMANWNYGDYSIGCASPPLVRMWAALPAFLAGANVPSAEAVQGVDLAARHWTYGRQFMNANRPRYHRIFVLSRLWMIPVSCLCAWILYRWATEIGGPAAGLVACAFYVLCPNILAHGSLVTTDVSTTTAMVAGAWLWWRYCMEPTWARAGWACLAIALAQLCKFTALFLWPILIISGVVAALAGARSQRRMQVSGLAAVMLASLLAVNAAYRFHGTGERLGNYTFRSNSLSRLAALPAGLPIPLPRDFVQGFDVQKTESEGQYAAFLLGDVYTGSKWYYYPVAVLCKTPTATLLCGAIAVALAVAGLQRASPRRIATAYILMCLLIIGLGMALLTDVNIGLRWILPAFPFAFLLIGLYMPVGRSLRGVAVVIAILAAAAEGAVVAPNYLTFFNVASGGAGRGNLILNDSNFDWGQDLMELKKWMDGRGVRRIGLCYFGSVDPGIYGIDYTPVTEGGREEYVAVSSYFLVGLSQRLPLATSRTETIRLPFHRELRAMPPVAVVGSTIFVYRRSDFVLAAAEQLKNSPAAPD